MRQQSAQCAGGGQRGEEKPRSKRAGGKICFGALDGCLYALNADGTLAGKYDVGSPIVGKPAVVDGGMIVSDFSGNVTKVAFSALGI